MESGVERARRMKNEERKAWSSVRYQLHGFFFFPLLKLTDGWDGCHDLAELQLVQDGGLTGSVKTHHQNAHLLLSEERGKQLSE